MSGLHGKRNLLLLMGTICHIHLSRELLLLAMWRGDNSWDGLVSNSTLVSVVFDLAELKYFRMLRLFSLAFARRNNVSDKLLRLAAALCTGVRCELLGGVL